MFSRLLQLTYSMTRFAVYEVVKNTMADRSRDASGKAPPLSFLQKAALAGISGFAGGLVGNPADLVNVRSVPCIIVFILHSRFLNYWLPYLVNFAVVQVHYCTISCLPLIERFLPPIAECRTIWNFLLNRGESTWLSTVHRTSVQHTGHSLDTIS